MKRPFPTYYANLKVSEDAPNEVIRASWKCLMQKYHPDRSLNKEKAAEMERISKLINEAYEVLSDPQKRREHDEWIASEAKKYTNGYGNEAAPLSPNTDVKTYPRARVARAASLGALVVAFGIAGSAFYPKKEQIKSIQQKELIDFEAYKANLNKHVGEAIDGMWEHNKASDYEADKCVYEGMAKRSALIYNWSTEKLKSLAGKAFSPQDNAEYRQEVYRLVESVVGEDSGGTYYDHLSEVRRRAECTEYRYTFDRSYSGVDNFKRRLADAVTKSFDN